MNKKDEELGQNAMTREMLSMLMQLGDAAAQASDEIYDDDWDAGTAGILRLCDLLVEKIDQYNVMPDSTVTREEMRSYGYRWDGMLPISKEVALRLFPDFTVYLLYSDDTEGTAESEEQIRKHDGMFGIEETAWLNRGNVMCKKTENQDKDRKPEMAYLVLKANYGVPDVDIVERNEMSLFHTRTEALAELNKRKDAYLKEAHFTFLPDESSETSLTFAEGFEAEDGTSDGKFVISLFELPFGNQQEEKCVAMTKQQAIHEKRKIPRICADSGQGEILHKPAGR